MLAANRLDEIRRLIRKNNSVLVSELAQNFDVTEETIRRDLKQLEAEGILTRVYGGAYKLDGVKNDVNASLKQNIMNNEKAVIASLTLPLINDGDSIFLDASTTAVALAKLLVNKPITVVTNSFLVAQCFATGSAAALYLIGGRYNSVNSSYGGAGTIREIGNYYFDKTIFSCRALSLESGISDPDQEQALLRSTVMTRCDQSILIADHTKLGRTSFYKIANLSKLDTLVTDLPVPDNWKTSLEAAGVTVITGG